ncbi:MAG: hypothetical protein E6G76_07050 [Alphaproteobacteria bacterium]|nr:MAG: hypothetical protein E6G76_07050 [Alphaproteobacteria bacterium]
MWLPPKAAHSVYSPPPCGEGLGVGVARCFSDGATNIPRTTPLPTPPPQGGREQTEFAARADFICHQASMTGRDDA